MSMLWGKAMTTLGSLFTPLGTKASLNNMFERCFNARTKKEEERLIEECNRVVKCRLEDPTSTPSIITRGLAFAVFADLLGYKSDFAHIHAVKLAQFGSLCEKKIGYLSCIYLMQPSDPLAIMVINTILQDLGSKNILVVAMAASASCYLIPRNLTSTVLPLLAEKLNHPSDFLRGKAVIAFQHFLRFCPEHCCHYMESVCALLGDKDPCVVGYVLQFLLDATKVKKSLLIKFVPILINIQYQILTGKLSHVYNYQGLLAPWMQITLLSLLQKTEGYMSEISAVSHKTLEILKKNEKVILREAVKIECLCTLLHCEGEQGILEMAMTYTEELLASTNCNLRYAGLELLQTIIHRYQITLTSQQQRDVFKYLEHPDPTVKHKTLNILCVAASEKNVDIICSQVADNALSNFGGNKHLQAELVKQAAILTDKFPNTNNYWHLAMLIRLLPLADSIELKLIQQRIKTALSSDSEQNIIKARCKVLQILRKYSGSRTASTSVLEMFVWAVGHFGMNSGDSSHNNSEQVVQEIVELGRKILKHQVLESCLPSEIETLLVAINDALTYIINCCGVSYDIVEYIQEVKSMAVNNSYLHKYCSELLHSLPHSQDLQKYLKEINWCKKSEEVDLTLSFLDWYVCESIRTGENPCHPKLPKLHNSEVSLPLLDAECILYSSGNYLRDTSTICTSPVSSEKESCFGSFSSEDLKFPTVKSSVKDVTEVKIIWTKRGCLDEEDTMCSALDKIPQVPFEDSFENSYKMPHSLCTEDGVNSEKKEVEGKHDPLETLLNEDFQKLSVSTKKS